MGRRGRSSVLEFHVPGRPVPKSRPRMGRGGKWYTPKRTREYEKLVAEYAVASRPPRWRRTGDFCVEITAGGFRGDVDNVVKAVLDALRGVVWEDDSYVTEIVARRAPSPGLTVRVTRR